MNRNRPVNLDISTIKLPITAFISITHRISGIIMIPGVLVLFWLFDASLRSESSFAQLLQRLEEPGWRVVLWLVLAALAYHFWMGVRHLIMDLGIGESYKGGRTGAVLALLAFAVSALAMGVWLLW